MAQGYTRNDTANNIADANIIDAVDLDGEFDALAAAFTSVTGHAHDGTAANGATIGVLGPNQDVVITSATLRPKTDNTVDLGTNTLEFKDLYIDGVANIDSLVADTADINAGTIDGVTIATSDITVGAGKTLNVSAGTLTLADNQISGDKVEGGTINTTTINTLTSTTVDTTNLKVTNLKAKDGTSAGSIADATGVVTLTSLASGGTVNFAGATVSNGGSVTTVDINGGTIDGTSVGATTASTGNFTSLVATTADINGGTIDGTSIGATTASTIRGTTITATTGFTGDLTGNVAGTVLATNLFIAGVAVTASAEELNFVDNVTSSIQTQLNSKISSVSPALTGTPTAPTAATNTNTTQIATTAYVVAQIADDAPTKTGGGASGTGWDISITGSSGSTTGNAATATNLTGMTTSVAELNLLSGLSANVRQLNSSSEDVNSENKIINGNFGIWQRGTVFTTSAYSADRWINEFSGGTSTQSQQAFNLGDMVGPNCPQYLLRHTVVSSTASSHFARLTQRVEDVRSYAGQTITVLGYARRYPNGSASMVVEGSQFFSLGSPGNVNGINPTTVTVSDSWQPFAAVMNIPSISGKVIADEGNDYLSINFWLSASLNFASRTNSLGPQSTTVDFWGIHIRQGTWTAADAALYRPRDPGTELALCQRYYEIFNATAAINGSYVNGYSFPVTKRIVPAITAISGSLAGSTWQADQNRFVQINNSSGASGVVFGFDAEIP